MYARVLGLLVACLMLTWSGWTVPAPAAASSHPGVAPEFAAYYHAVNGPATLGAPVSGASWQSGHLVQYFERARLEHHAGATPAVQLGRLGAELTEDRDFPTVEPFASTSDRWFIPETSHSLPEPFLSAWQARGGVGMLGFPISEPMDEGGRTIQHFERARLEWFADANEVRQAWLGWEAWQQLSASLVGLTGEEEQLAALLNAARAEAGQPALTLEPRIMALARERSQDMATRRYFSHTTPEGKTVLTMLPERGINFQYAGETLQQNNYPVGQTVAEAARSLLASPAHREILLDGRFSHFGLAHAAGGSMHYYTVIVVQF
jgi:hypothetical protein